MTHTVRFFVMSATICALLGFTACGKKKNTQPAPPPAATTPQVEPTPPTDQTGGDQTQISESGENDQSAGDQSAGDQTATDDGWRHYPDDDCYDPCDGGRGDQDDSSYPVPVDDDQLPGPPIPDNHDRYPSPRNPRNGGDLGIYTGQHTFTVTECKHKTYALVDDEGPLHPNANYECKVKKEPGFTKTVKIKYSSLQHIISYFGLDLKVRKNKVREFFGYGEGEGIGELKRQSFTFRSHRGGHHSALEDLSREVQADHR